MEILKLWVVTSCTVADRNMRPYLQGRRWRWKVPSTYLPNYVVSHSEFQ